MHNVFFYERQSLYKYCASLYISIYIYIASIMQGKSVSGKEPHTMKNARVGTIFSIHLRTRAVFAGHAFVVSPG